MVFCTSIFSIPADADQWPAEIDGITTRDIEETQQKVDIRNKFAQPALDGGFSDVAIFRPNLKPWMIHKLKEHRFQEKQVDTTVVALMVRAAILQPNDFHAIVTGDADILPAISGGIPRVF